MMKQGPLNPDGHGHNWNGPHFEKLAHTMGAGIVRARLPKEIDDLVNHADRREPPPDLHKQALIAERLVTGWAAKLFQQVVTTPAARASEARIVGNAALFEQYANLHFVDPELSGAVGSVDSFRARVQREAQVVHELVLTFVMDAKVFFAIDAFLEQVARLNDIEAEPNRLFRKALTSTVNEMAAEQVDVLGRSFDFVLSPTSVVIEARISGRSDEGIGCVILSVQKGNEVIFRFSLYSAGGGRFAPYVDFPEQGDTSRGVSEGADHGTIEELLIGALEHSRQERDVPVISDDFRVAGQTVLSVSETAQLLVDCWIQGAGDSSSS
jgi:hypothetical protein